MGSFEESVVSVDKGILKGVTQMEGAIALWYKEMSYRECLAFQIKEYDESEVIKSIPSFGNRTVFLFGEHDVQVTFGESTTSYEDIKSVLEKVIDTAGTSEQIWYITLEKLVQVKMYGAIATMYIPTWETRQGKLIPILWANVDDPIECFDMIRLVNNYIDDRIINEQLVILRNVCSDMDTPNEFSMCDEYDFCGFPIIFNRRCGLSVGRITKEWVGIPIVAAHVYSFGVKDDPSAVMDLEDYVKKWGDTFKVSAPDSNMVGSVKEDQVGSYVASTHYVSSSALSKLANRNKEVT